MSCNTLQDGDRVVIIEDVTTSGKSIEETYPIIMAQAKVEIRGLMVSLNRMEKGAAGDRSRKGTPQKGLPLLGNARQSLPA